MSVEIWVSVISAVVALSSIVISSLAARSTMRLQAELEERRRLATKEEVLEQIMSRYREPLLRAAFDLQSRVYNIVRQRFLHRYLTGGGRPAEQEYARTNTLFLLAEYLGWVEILRRGVQFLDLGDVKRNGELVDRLDRISTALSDDKMADDRFRLFRGVQRAIGELMIDPRPPDADGDVEQCIGYAAFTVRLQDKEFACWFEQLDADVTALAREPDPVYERLIALQGALMGLIDFLDDPPLRFPKQQRTRLS